MCCGLAVFCETAELSAIVESRGLPFRAHSSSGATLRIVMRSRAMQTGLSVSAKYALSVVLMISAVACDTGTDSCASGVFDNGKCTALLNIALSGAGFRKQDLKLATVYEDATGFVVKRSDGNEEVFRGVASGPNSLTESGSDAWVLDFSELDASGLYYLELDSGARSPEFRIADDVYQEPLTLALLGLYGQRCGTSVEISQGGDQFSHKACHQQKASAEQLIGESEPLDVSGGWHDAGDYGKYAVNGAFSVAFLLYAWEHFGASLEAIEHIPGYGEALPHLLAEARWELDWLAKMQMRDGGVAHQVRPAVYEPNIMPSSDVAPRYLSATSSTATADVAAVMALASRLFAPWDEERASAYLAVAERARTWLADHSELLSADQDFWPNTTYGDSSDLDERLWADIEWWLTSGDDTLLSAIEERLGGLSVVESSWDWQQVGNLGIFAYLMSDDDAKSASTVDALGALVLGSADAIERSSTEHAFGRGVESYYWGSNGVVARSCMNLTVARALSGENRYGQACALQIGHLLGRNHFARSQLTGLGYRPPLNPHHRPSRADSVTRPWPGLLVGGPNASSSDNPRLVGSAGPAEAWFDNAEDYFTNEVAINWNAALVYATAGLIAE